MAWLDVTQASSSTLDGGSGGGSSNGGGAGRGGAGASGGGAGRHVGRFEGEQNHHREQNFAEAAENLPPQMRFGGYDASGDMVRACLLSEYYVKVSRPVVPTSEPTIASFCSSRRHQ